MNAKSHPTFFRTYDLRGAYPSELGPAQAVLLGEAIGSVCHGEFLIGRDTRWESSQLERSLRTGLAATGALVRSTGIVPTPCLSFLSRRLGCVGLMVTPSHNALGQVGLKGFNPDGSSFARTWRQVRSEYLRVFGLRPTVTPEGGKRTTPVRTSGYLTHVSRGRHARTTVVVDTRGGATARIGPAALRRLGADVIDLRRGFSPTFHGTSPEPAPTNMGDLRRAVRDAGAEVGLAFDGDGDRVLFVDGAGSVVPPEAVAVWLRRALFTDSAPLVASSDASPRCEQLVRTIRSRVGGRYVTQKMESLGSEVGVEASSHFYLSRLAPDSDGILTACVLLDGLAKLGTTLRQVNRAFGRVYRQNLRWSLDSDPSVAQALSRIRQQDGLRSHPYQDGLTLELGSGWCFVRRSNTEPAFRVSIEAEDRPTLSRLVTSVKRVVRRSLPRKGRAN